MDELNLRLNDTEFSFNIAGLGDGHYEEINECWCVLGIIVKNRFFKYEEYGEMLDFGELQYLRASIDDLLKDKISSELKLSFVEPDLEFKLYPRLYLRTVESIGYVKEGYEIRDISADLILNLTDNNKAYTGERYVLPLYQEAIEFLSTYLNEMIPKLKQKWEKDKSWCFTSEVDK